MKLRTEDPPLLRHRCDPLLLASTPVLSHLSRWPENGVHSSMMWATRSRIGSPGTDPVGQRRLLHHSGLCAEVETAEIGEPPVSRTWYGHQHDRHRCGSPA